MAMPRRLAVLLPLAGLAAAPGCVWYAPHSMTRFWGDRNTLNRPAFFVERIAHAPPPRDVVEQIRWQYGVGPGLPVMVPPVADVGPLPDGQFPPGAAVSPAVPGPPPAPPPEPAGNAVEAPKARPSVAWLFTPARG
jgi:hypothetical protein